MLFGTSLEAQNGTFVGTFTGVDLSAFSSARGRAMWLQRYSSNRFDIVYIAGIGGNTYAQMRARVKACVLSYEPELVLMGWPANDQSNDVTGAQTIADADHMIGLFDAAGIATVPLTGTGHTSLDISGRRAQFDVWRAWALAQHGKRGAIVVDTRPETADATNYAPFGNLAVDYVHYLLVGTQVVGRLAAQQVAASMPAPPPTNMLDEYGASVAGNETFTSGTGWSTSGSGGTVTAACYGRAMLDVSGYTAKRFAAIEYLENISRGRFATGDMIQVLAASSAGRSSSPSAWHPRRGQRFA